jgi:hypothetical protein
VRLVDQPLAPPAALGLDRNLAALVLDAEASACDLDPTVSQISRRGTL